MSEAHAGSWLGYSRDLHADLDFAQRRLGFEVVEVYPADAPRNYVLARGASRLRLEAAESAHAALLFIEDPRAPNDGGDVEESPGGGLRVVRARPPAREVPALQAQFTHTSQRGAQWIEGRAGMRYRDLIPGRQGGRYAASHIQIRDAGPVADYVHFHEVRFQLIYCWKGSALLVYENEGDPFWMKPGDCVLQAPTLRHRVLETDGTLDVVEVSCPAEHRTLADRGFDLPNREPSTPRAELAGQRFARTRSADSDECEISPHGMRAPSCEQVEVSHVRARSAKALLPSTDELNFYFVLAGHAALCCGSEHEIRIEVGDGVVVPTGARATLHDASEGFEALLVEATPRSATH